MATATTDERAEIDRRSVFRKPLQVAAAVAAVAAATSCDLTTADFDSDRHLARRLTFGPDPQTLGDIASMGRSAWVDAQFAPSGLDHSAVDAKLAQLPALTMNPVELQAAYPLNSDRTAAGAQLKLGSLIRWVHSPAQLFERMVEFWSDHFNVPAEGAILNLLKIVEDREAIRPNALGRFKDLIVASAKSPAMLVYLDNAFSSVGAINENYARELLELHTVGVDGGYTEDDIVATARLLTGWTVDPQTGEFIFRPARHDSAQVTIMGWTRPASGDPVAHGEAFLHYLAMHPNTAVFVSGKIATRFVSDTPSKSLVDAMAAAWAQNDSAIEPVLRAMINHPDFDAAPPKFRRPLDYLAMVCRAVHADIAPTSNVAQLIDLYRTLVGLGQAPFEWPAPNGYPDVASPWLNGGSLLNRWNLTGDVIAGHHVSIQPDPTPLRPQLDRLDRTQIYETVTQFLLDESPTSQGLIALDAATGWTSSTAPSPTEINESLAALVLAVLTSADAQYR